MADNFNPAKRHSSASTSSLTKKSAKTKEFARTEHRSKRSRPIEAISEVTLNNVGTEDDTRVKFKRNHSVPHRHRHADAGYDNPAYEDNNQNVVDIPPVNEKSIPIDDYDHQPHTVNSTGIHYGSSNSNINGAPTVHFISGHVNQAYVSSMPPQYSPHSQQNQNMLPPNSVHREQYWAWPCCQQRWTWNWSRREKTLLLVILGQSFIIFGLVIGLLKIILDKDITIGKPGILDPLWNVK